MPKFMLLTRHEAGQQDVPPMTSWDPADMQAHLAFLRLLNEELTAAGELVEVQVLVGPEAAKTVSTDLSGAPVVTDGPFAEAKEVLAGYQIVDVDSEERAIEIAARVAAAPGPRGVPIQQRIEVRQVMSPGGVL